MTNMRTRQILVQNISSLSKQMHSSKCSKPVCPSKVWSFVIKKKGLK